MKSKNLKPFYSNKNIPKKVRKGEVLYVDELFYSIQTEGPFSGHPAYFIRLFGCSLNCSFCDTPQEKRKPLKMSVSDIVANTTRNSASPLVIITGGEPLLFNMGPLVNALIAEGFWIQFETSGSVPLKGINPDMESVKFVVSPKTKKVDKHIAKHAVAFKYVVSTKNVNPRDGLPKNVYRPKEMRRCMVSPMWSDKIDVRSANIDMAVSIAEAFGYYMTLQWHKLIDIS